MEAAWRGPKRPDRATAVALSHPLRNIALDLQVRKYQEQGYPVKPQKLVFCYLKTSVVWDENLSFLLVLGATGRRGTFKEN